MRPEIPWIGKVLAREGAQSVSVWKRASPNTPSALYPMDARRSCSRGIVVGTGGACG